MIASGVVRMVNSATQIISMSSERLTIEATRRALSFSSVNAVVIVSAFLLPFRRLAAEGISSGVFHPRSISSSVSTGGLPLTPCEILLGRDCGGRYFFAG